VGGLSDKLYFHVVGELLLASEEFDIDVIPMESITRTKRNSIEKGIILYGKR